MARTVDADFRALPLQALADAALQRARDLGVEHADLRVERGRTTRTATPESVSSPPPARRPSRIRT